MTGDRPDTGGSKELDETMAAISLRLCLDKADPSAGLPDTEFEMQFVPALFLLVFPYYEDRNT